MNHAFVIGMVKKICRDMLGLPLFVNLPVLLIALVIYSVMTQLFVSKTTSIFSAKKRR